MLIGTCVESQNTQFRLVSCQCGGRQFGHITVRHANCSSINLTTQFILITPKTTESLHTMWHAVSFVLPFARVPDVVVKEVHVGVTSRRHRESLRAKSFLVSICQIQKYWKDGFHVNPPCHLSKLNYLTSSHTYQ